jgi:sensor domain CHASE-containing protein
VLVALAAGVVLIVMTLSIWSTVGYARDQRIRRQASIASRVAICQTINIKVLATLRDIISDATAAPAHPELEPPDRAAARVIFRNKELARLADDDCAAIAKGRVPTTTTVP